MKVRSVLCLLAMTVGLGLIAAAVLAPQLGLDSNADWGPSRKLLLLVGILAIAAGWIDRLARLVGTGFRAAGEQGARLGGKLAATTGANRLYRRLVSCWRASSLANRLTDLREVTGETWQRWLSRSPVLTRLLGTSPARVRAASWVAFAVVALSYLWLVSVGGWFRWPGSSSYYDLQAQAFVAGQAHLLPEPSPDLLALPNPYDPQTRASVQYIWDASLYHGRFYLYWGPVPSLLIAPVRALLDRPVGDDALVFLFSVGVLFWCTRLLLRVWLEHFRRIPGWVVPAAVLTVGWANPAPWILNSPWIYEAAIVGGQFFFLMGMYALYRFWMSTDVRAADLVWAGVSFALAVGTRVSLIPAVAAVTTVLLLRAWTLRGAWKPARAISLLAAFALPLVVGASALAAYNQVRFGSPLEFGHSYQLTSLDLTRQDLAPTAPGNIPPNLYNYLVNPVRTLPVFPYIKPHWGGTGMSVLRIPVPTGYYSRQVTGLLLIAPFLLFALEPARFLWRRFRARGASRRSAPAADRLTWLTIALMAAGAAQFLVVQSYIVSAMRYHGDFTAVWAVVATIGFWEVLAARMEDGRSPRATQLIALALMTWTAVAGMLLGITGQFARFEKVNPELFERLTELFTF